MFDARNLLKIENQVLGSGLLYGCEAIKIIEKEGTIIFKTPGGNKLWSDIKELADEGVSPDKIQIGLIKKGYPLKKAMSLQSNACSMEALESRVTFLREEMAREIAIREKEKEIEDLRSGISSPSNHGPKIMTSAEILQQDFPEPEWVIPGILPVGTSILAGPPKKGKSWMVLNWAVALTSGGRAMGKIPVEKTDVLYLALEDFPRRIQTRLKQIGAKPSDNYRIAFDWRKGIDGTTDLDLHLEQNPEIRFVIIDTLEKFRAPQTGNRNIYSDDYEAIGLLKKITDKRGVGLLVVHHTRKNEGNDPLEQVSGSFGLTGAADNIIILSRGKGQADGALYITGRDTEEKEFALKFAPHTGWDLMGDAKEYAQSEERQMILNVLKEADSELTPKEISELTGKSTASVKVMLGRMVKENVIEKTGHGKYQFSCNNKQSYFVTFDGKPRTKQEEKKVTPKNDESYFVTFDEQSNKVTPGNNKGVTYKNSIKQGVNEESNKVTQKDYSNIDIFDLDFG